MFVNIVLIGAAALWLFVHLSVKHRFRELQTKLPGVYQTAIAVPPQEGAAPQLIALSVDLLRKQHCAVPLDALSINEKRVVLHAYAVEELPAWMTGYAVLRLPTTDRAIVQQLRQVATSRPTKPKMHFGAIRQQQQLRLTSKN